MARTSVYCYDEVDGELRRELDGWFDRDQVKAEYPEADSDEEPAAGSRKVRKRNGVQRAVRQTLLRTAGGRWVLETRLVQRDMAERSTFGDRCAFLSDEQATDWLVRNGHGQAVEQWLPDLPAERGPGRPEIGGRVQVRLGELLGDVDRFAEENGYSRAEAVRALVAIGLRPRGDGPGSV